jgi:hypothetical protein
MPLLAFAASSSAKYETISGEASEGTISVAPRSSDSRRIASNSARKGLGSIFR